MSMTQVKEVYQKKKKTRARRKLSTLVLIHHFKCMNKETKATKLGVKTNDGLHKEKKNEHVMFLDKVSRWD
jgi:hypothetical protein